MSRNKIEPITGDIPAARQEASRHYGVHPYFTRRPSNVVRAYLERYSSVDDVVLDPFGGSGVTAIEAMLMGRRAIHNDLNPFANFITAAIADTSLSSVHDLHSAFEKVATRCQSAVEALETQSLESIEALLQRLDLPKNIRLPRSSDAEYFYDLFTSRQLAGLALIKQAIDEEERENLRNLMLLAWSAAIAKLNKTFLSAKGRRESRGGSSIFSIYRYKVAAEIVELPIWQTFHGRFLNVVAAKDEILQLCNYARMAGTARGTIESDRQLRILARDATNLSEALGEESVDYIFTDPPYGGHIAYLDLSILWNHWLGFETPDGKSEAIVGGEQRLSEEHYKSKLESSIRECMKLLRPDRWVTVVFQHWDVSYFEVILDAATADGAQLRAAITHDKDVIWSMHKKKNSENVLGGEMLLTFYKPKVRSIVRSERLPVSLQTLLDELLPTLPETGFRTEALFNKLTITAWEHNSVHNVAVTPEQLSEMLQARGWTYDRERHFWSRLPSEVRTELALSDF